MNNLRVKVCGLRDNVEEVLTLQPDFCGFIFYEKSSRYVGRNPNLPEYTNSMKVGVFVDETIGRIAEITKEHKLDFVQLHSDQSIGFILNLKNLIPEVGVIKVFRVTDSLPFDLDTFNEVADLFLFDTKVDNYGGSGHQFDWSILNDERIQTPFILAGGIGETDLEQIESLKNEYLYGIDLNSKFELEPGLKDINKLESFINSVRNE